PICRFYLDHGPGPIRYCLDHGAAYLGRATITEINGTTLRGRGWDALADKEAPFEVDLKTGKHTGGSRP
ncbi:MAG TPA: hypothetical protein VKL99_10715, partial [Candidatus Angelobacter sp.]|nr:hypothetical protein [Candidatus Angelobacter sp.]